MWEPFGLFKWAGIIGGKAALAGFCGMNFKVIFWNARF
jgi:hypothetical protein